MATKSLKRIYVWQLPVRITHWLNALVIVVLIITGYLISDPPPIMSGEDPHYRHWFGTVRFIHFAAAYVLIFSYLVRFYWIFAGNKYSSWRAYMPVKRSFFKSFWYVLKYDILLWRGDYEGTVGHNAVAGFSYVILFIIVLLQVFTGFALYTDMSNWWLPDLFVWVTPLLGGDMAVRLLHYAVMWLFVVFILVHVYLVFFHGWSEGRGEVSSMVGGWKFLEEDKIEKFKKRAPKA